MHESRRECQGQGEGRHGDEIARVRRFGNARQTLRVKGDIESEMQTVRVREEKRR